MIAALLTTALAGSIEIEVSGARSDDGVVVADLFTSAEGFPTQSEKAHTRTSFPIVNGVAIVRFDGLDPGAYAVSMFHDADADGTVDTYWFGPPKEGLIASNGARGSFGPPSFEDARVRVSDEPVRQSVTLMYLFR